MLQLAIRVVVWVGLFMTMAHEHMEDLHVIKSLRHTNVIAFVAYALIALLWVTSMFTGIRRLPSAVAWAIFAVFALCGASSRFHNVVQYITSHPHPLAMCATSLMVLVPIAAVPVFDQRNPVAIMADPKAWSRYAFAAVMTSQIYMQLIAMTKDASYLKLAWVAAAAFYLALYVVTEVMKPVKLIVCWINNKIPLTWRLSMRYEFVAMFPQYAMAVLSRMPVDPEVETILREAREEINARRAQLRADEDAPEAP
jgi:hypothetical protein